MDLKHYEFITSCRILIGVYGRIFKAVATKIFCLTRNAQAKIFCGYSLENTPMDSNEDATACYELVML